MASGPQMLTLEQATWAFIEAGPKKHRSELGVRFCKAAMAGWLLSTGGTLVQIVAASPWLSTNTPGLLKIIQGAVFPLGLVMIVLFQADLVTGNMAIFIMATIKRKVPLWAFAVDWTICFIGNLIGALFYAGFVVHFGGIYSAPISTAAAAIGDAKVSAVNFREIFLRGVGCNYAVVAAVFLASLARDVVSKVVIAYLPIFYFVASGFEHVVANMFLIPEALMTKKTTFSVGMYIWKSIIASFLGNVVGAALLVIPLVYIHGRDEFDPSSVDQDLPSHDVVKTSHESTIAGPQHKTPSWRDDVERTAAAQ